jgi:hypothetical protein
MQLLMPNGSALNMENQATPFLMFEGTAEKAMGFYASIFSASKVSSISRYGPGEPGKKLLCRQHEVTDGNSVLGLSVALEAKPCQPQATDQYRRAGAGEEDAAINVRCPRKAGSKQADRRGKKDHCHYGADPERAEIRHRQRGGGHREGRDDAQEMRTARQAVQGADSERGMAMRVAPGFIVVPGAAAWMHVYVEVSFHVAAFACAVRVLVFMNMHTQRVPERPQSDADQQHAHKPVAPARNQVQRENAPEQQRK